MIIMKNIVHVKICEINGITRVTKGFDLKGNNVDGYKAFDKKDKKWKSAFLLIDDLERKVGTFLFDGSDTTLYYLEDESYTAMKDLYIVLSVVDTEE